MLTPEQKHHNTCMCKPCLAQKMAKDVKEVVESFQRSVRK